jgi:hypothetical protein
MFDISQLVQAAAAVVDRLDARPSAGIQWWGLVPVEAHVSRL